jgi:osmotically-inducible protein OsmY
MKHPYFFSLSAVALLSVFLSGCAILSGDSSSAESGQESRYDDAGIKTAIASGLLRADAAKANKVNVHCYDGHIFLIGEADKEFRAEALDIARKAEGAAHVTTHWFPPGTSSPLRDTAIEAEIGARLFFADDINARRVAVDVWGGHVVLTGSVGTQPEIDETVAAIKEITQVKSVTSYLSLSRGKRADAPEKRKNTQPDAARRKPEGKNRNPPAAVSG